jgi:hypothetical protein
MTGTDRRTLTTIPGARWPVPWRLRRGRIESEMRERSPERLEGRLACIDYTRHINTAGTAHPFDPTTPIWQFWATGPDTAPPLVQRCLASVPVHAGNRPVIVLDQDTYRDYITLPAHIEDRREHIGWTHFSDILRVFLLAKHGGTWIDATAFLSAPAPADVANLPLFAFTRPEDPFVLSSWYLQASRAHPAVVSVRDMLDAYWKDNDDLVDYFLIHFMFEAAITADSTVRSAWLDTPVRDFQVPHLVQHRLADRMSKADLLELMKQSWIHKLTYKLPAEAAEPDSAASVLARL